jgi:hypothetical protein
MMSGMFQMPEVKKLQLMTNLEGKDEDEGTYLEVDGGGDTMDGADVE